MSATPDFLDHHRPAVPDLVVPRAVTVFYLQDRPVRGRLVRLGALADALLSRHDNPESILTLTGETLALTAALATGLKFRGSFSIQAKGNGPVTLLVADCTDQGELRGYAKFDHDALAKLETVNTGALLGEGYMAFTVDQGPDTDRYQGLVGIRGDSLSDIALHYFETSEQIPTHLHLACRRTDRGWRASALVMQRIAGEGGIGEHAIDPDDAWNTALALAATLSDEELLDDSLPPEQLLFQLFHQEEVCAERPRALAYGCRCSRARLSGLLASFADDDIADMAEEGVITMTCEFCNVDFKFEQKNLHRPG
jgi:molecular chaperone Hsp33